MLEKLKSGFKRSIAWNKYEPKATVEQQNQCLDFLINPIFQGVNSSFVYHLKILIVKQVTRDIIIHL